MKNTLEMRDLYNNEELRFIYNYMTMNKDLSERLKKDLNLKCNYNKSRGIESCVEEYKECDNWADYLSKYRKSYNWLYRNNRIEEFKERVGLKKRQSSEDKLNDLVNKWKGKITQITDVKKNRAADYIWLLNNGLLDEFKKLVGIS